MCSVRLCFISAVASLAIGCTPGVTVSDTGGGGTVVADTGTVSADVEEDSENQVVDSGRVPLDTSERQVDTSPEVDTTQGRDTGRSADTAMKGKGTSIGTFTNTYYYLSDESAYSGPDDTTLYDSSCQPLAEVPADYADSVCIEGSGLLEDGTVINYASTCSCGRPCPTGGTVCYKKLDKSKYPWGEGSKGNALEPLRSWAVDTSVVSFGTVLYAPKWDGVKIPKLDGIGGFTHDGCFRADDVGGGIDGKHFDFFAGTTKMWKKLEKIYPTRTNFDVYKDSPRCSGL